MYPHPGRRFHTEQDIVAVEIVAWEANSLGRKYIFRDGASHRARLGSADLSVIDLFSRTEELKFQSEAIRRVTPRYLAKMRERLRVPVSA